HAALSGRPTFLPRLPPSSSPCPYTTLFRSDLAFSGSPPGCSSPLEVPTASSMRSPIVVSTFFQYCSALLSTGSSTVLSEPATVSDRKSTRLNSSHGSFSYAVLCLKNHRRHL